MCILVAGFSGQAVQSLAEIARAVDLFAVGRSELDLASWRLSLPGVVRRLVASEWG